MTDYDLAIIGAGPAGLAGAVAAASAGLRVALVDGGRQLGGQYFRHPAPSLGAQRPDRLHHGWSVFTHLAERCRGLQSFGRIDHLGDHAVWAVEPSAAGFAVHAVIGHASERRASVVRCRALLLATGAYERQIPFPGWDLPGVFTAGGAQALLKGNLVLAGQRVVVAGTGPLLLPVAAGLSSAGANVLGLFEANKFRGYAHHPLPLLTNPGKLVEGAGYARQLALGRVPVRTGYAVIAAEGHDALEAVVVTRLDASGHPITSTTQRIVCDTLAIGYGLVPQIELGLELGCEHRIVADGSAALVVDDAQRTSHSGIWAAGESVGVAGAQTALIEGEIAGLAIAKELGFADQQSRFASAHGSGGRAAEDSVGVGSADQRSDGFATDASLGAAVGQGSSRAPSATPATSATASDYANQARAIDRLKRRRDRQRAFADLILAQHPIPSAWPTWLTPDTTVCRCEEVPVAAIREAVSDLGATDVRTIKLLTRAGMGWCQGRMCGYAVACLAAARPDTGTSPGSGPSAGLGLGIRPDIEPETQPSPTDLLAAARRPLARPIPLGLLATEPESEPEPHKDQHA